MERNRNVFERITVWESKTRVISSFRNWQKQKKAAQETFTAEEQAYCQGYADCIQLLARLGVLKNSPYNQPAAAAETCVSESVPAVVLIWVPSINTASGER